MEIIVFSLILFIIGVGSTIIYDKYKSAPKTTTNKPINNKKEIDDLIKKIKSQVNPPKKKKTKKSLVRRIKPNSLNFITSYTHNQIPTETEYETFTVQDLLDMAEGRKTSPSEDIEWAKSYIKTIEIED